MWQHARLRAAVERILATMIKSYDPTVLGEFAERLIAKADRVVARYAALGLVFGALAYFMTRGFVAPGPGFGYFAALVTFLVFVYIGYEQAFRYRVQAHTVLCQVAIEMNTRHLALTIATQAATTNAHPYPPSPAR
jgi:hypothetical protein